MLRQMYDDVGFPWRKTAVVAASLVLLVSMYAIFESRTSMLWRVKGKSEETLDSGGLAIAVGVDFFRDVLFC